MRLSIIFLLCLAASAQEQSATVGTANVQAGKLVQGRYVNDSLGISYPLPDPEWYINEDLVNSGAPGHTRRLPDGSSLLLVADRHTGRPLRNRLLLIADDKSRYSPSLSARDYVAKVVRAQTKTTGVLLIRDVFPMEFAGRQFFRADYNENSSAGSMCKAFMATEFKEFFLSWTFVAGSVDELDQLAQSLRQTSFREEDSQPIAGAVVPSPPKDLAPPPTSPPAITQPPSEHPSRVRVSEVVSQAFLVKKVQPDYPEEARKNHVHGRVVMKAVISQTGDVKDLTLMSGDPSLAPAALEAVRQWKYKPYYLQGSPVQVETQITVAFQLAGN